MRQCGIIIIKILQLLSPKTDRHVCHDFIIKSLYIELELDLVKVATRPTVTLQQNLYIKIYKEKGNYYCTIITQ